ncbi:hypothetical protein NE237_007347 [Protea cynaroides]|uniref:AAA+ ATPase domain-containing protein n=1 Tax=Protea cynaroides TaxID=273540 RepID=A0A9Q0QW58_9MAGN|nr:hypothetical protein NE237_007347 [Protea cynaroides]
MMMMTTGELWTSLGSTAGTIMLVWAMFRSYVPYDIREYLIKYGHQFMSFLSPYIEITFQEYTDDLLLRSPQQPDASPNDRNLVFSMDDYEEVTDEFQGVKLRWSSNKNIPMSTSIIDYPGSNEKRYYKLKFHKRHRELVTSSYLNHVREEGKAIGVRNRQRKLYTNNKSDNWYRYRGSVWSHVVFEHPATFQKLAMDPVKKKEIVDDLITFSKSKEYYKKIGKAWKRGYLLYGPPGTGKSSMIAAMANFLDYDIYDLELTTVKDNTELRKLLIEISSKSVVVIEDIDCSLDLTGQRRDRKKSKEEKEKKEGEAEQSDSIWASQLLNFIDGLWSAGGGERLIVFTTNHVDQLDPALTRRGRMDKHIEMSYCNYEGFKVLAKNYLDLESHPLFNTIHGLMDETQITPADVAENLMPKSLEDNCK